LRFGFRQQFVRESEGGVAVAASEPPRKQGR